jgi:hypothetical protein
MKEQKRPQINPANPNRQQPNQQPQHQPAQKPHQTPNMPKKW